MITYIMNRAKTQGLNSYIRPGALAHRRRVVYNKTGETVTDGGPEKARPEPKGTKTRGGIAMGATTVLKQKFYDNLRRRMLQWVAGRAGEKASRLAGFALLVPDVAVLIGRLMLDERVPRHLRIKLGMIFVYLASPLDLIPEAILGPVGMVEDVVLAAFALNRIFREVEPGVLEELWSGKPEHLKTLRELAELVDGIFGGRVGTTLNQWYAQEPPSQTDDDFAGGRTPREVEVEIVREEGGGEDLVERLRASGL